MFVEVTRKGVGDGGRSKDKVERVVEFGGVFYRDRLTPGSSDICQQQLSFLHEVGICDSSS